MKINFGCGNKKMDGFLNADKEAGCNPDQVMDMESFPWPFEENSVEEVVLQHVLEHVGAETETHKRIIQELYRICKPRAKIQIIVPHPRSAYYLADATHVRPISAETFNLYSKSFCKNAISMGWASTPLAIYWKVDFTVKKVVHYLMPEWLKKHQDKEITDRELTFAINSYNNVVNEIEVVLEVNKGT